MTLEITYVSDAVPPELVECPENILVVAPPMSLHQTVSWTTPTYKDNSGLAVTVDQITGRSKESLFQEGVHLIEYKGSDIEGNKNLDCQFKVRVRGKHAPFYSEYGATYFSFEQDVHEFTLLW